MKKMTCELVPGDLVLEEGQALILAVIERVSENGAYIDYIIHYLLDNTVRQTECPRNVTWWVE
jgi:hypothetical protein